MTGKRKKEAAPCSLNRAVTASFKLETILFFDTVHFTDPRYDNYILIIW